MPPQQLNQLYQTIGEEVEYLTNSLGQLKGAQQKFVESERALAAMGPESEGKESLIPMTSSLYVPGTLAHNQRVLVDVGTGYFIEKTVPAASDFFSRRAGFLKAKIEELQPVVMAKVREKGQVEDVLQARMNAAQSQGAAKK